MNSTRKFLTIGAFVGSLAVIMFWPQASAQAQRTITPEFDAKVIHVDDGDTVVALRGSGERQKVRLANIDAPEVQHGRCRPGQPFGQKATDALERLVKGKQIGFVCHTLDRYDRAVCDLKIGDTTASRELARQGLVWANRANPGYLRDRKVAEAEREAQARRIGLWADDSAVRPWEWRRSRWTNAC